MLRSCSFFLSVILMIITIWFSNQPQPALAHTKKKECLSRCGKVDIPPPFGIGPNCSQNENFTISCNYSPLASSYVPILEKLDLEVLEVRNIGVYRATVIVKVPSFTTCRGNRNSESNSSIPKEQWNSPRISGSGFFVNYVNNVFVAVGCNGFAAVYNETGGLITGCSSVCPSSPNLNGLNYTECYGNRCCKEDVIAFDPFGSYSIGVGFVNGSGNCMSAVLIDRAYFITNNASSLASSSVASVPLALYWSSTEGSGIPTPKYNAAVFIVLIIGVPIVGGIIWTGATFWLGWLCKNRKRRKEINLRGKYFRKRLEEQATIDKEAVENTKLFTIKELKTATGNFKKDFVLGQGGQGTVYKGILINGQVIAVKRSKIFNDNQWKEFINEVILLSQIKHRHVVKLLGCCLETTEPLVVYEFIPNGTLFEHIHNSTKEFPLSWETRLRIAAESANAVSYLHSESPTAIYHRDIKSSNILLDHNYMAKVSDFGISKAVSEGQTHLSTFVQGTLGYLDPEYFWSSQFSEKSDVYSFGVVLVELLTGQKAIRSPNSSEDNEGEEDERSLVEYFMSSMTNSTLYNILDPIVLQSNAKEEFIEVANLAKLCLNPRGTLRPTMKEVAVVLGALRCRFSSRMSIGINDQLSGKELDSDVGI